MLIYGATTQERLYYPVKTMSDYNRFAHNKLAYFLWLIGIKAATGPAALSELQDAFYGTSMPDMSQDNRTYSDVDYWWDDDGTGNTDNYAMFVVGDARDLRACGCDWSEYCNPRLTMWRQCSAPLLSMLHKLGVVRGEDDGVETDERRRCGAW